MISGIRSTKERLFLAALFILNLLLVGPWLLLDMSNQPWNNDYMYIAMARMFRDLPWTWNPLQYGGAPFRYLYPPLLHVLIAAMPRMSLGHAFHLVAGLSYALTPIALFFTARRIFESRIAAAVTAVAWTLFPSPAYLMTSWHVTVKPLFYAPWPFLSTVTYDEAPHSLGFLFIVLAVGALWSGRWKRASLLCAAVFLTSWTAVVGLGLALAAMMVAKSRSEGWRAVLQAGGVAGAGYGLSAFWITPGYFLFSTSVSRIVLRHTLPDAPWNSKTWLFIGIAVALVALALWRKIPSAVAFAVTLVAVSGLVIVAYTVAGNDLVPFPHRYMLEFNLGFDLLLGALIAAAPATHRRLVAVVILILGAAFAYRFTTHAWRLAPHPANEKQLIAYQTAQAIPHSSRVLVSGELDGTLPLWSNVPQVGGSGQGVSNFLIFAAERQMVFGCGPDAVDLSELWLRALNVQAAVIHGPQSAEYFHWFAGDAVSAVNLPVLHDDGAGNQIRRVPEVSGTDAVVVDMNAYRQLPPLDSTADLNALRAYVNWAAGTRPAAIRWAGNDHAILSAALQPGEAVLLKMNNDPGWRSPDASIQSDSIGFQIIQPKAGRTTIDLRFGAAPDVWLARVITAMTALLLLLGIRPYWIALAAVLPAAVAWALLAHSATPRSSVAEEAFIRLQPPLINPGGIVDSQFGGSPNYAPGEYVSIYGLNFGGANDTVAVLFGDRTLTPAYHSQNLVNFQVPKEKWAHVPIGLEVNGCRGNSFAR